MLSAAGQRLALAPAQQRTTPRRRCFTIASAAQEPRQSALQAAGRAAAAAAAALLLAAAPGPGHAKELIQGYPRVVDGDTLDFSGTRVRLFGIDAPETKQSCSRAGKGGEYLCGETSKQALLSKIGKQLVQCEQKNRDKYGRVVGVCSLRGGAEDLNAWMVQEGLAVAYRQYSKAYVPLEEEARQAGKGIWSGSFELPERWRQQNPRTGGKAPSAAVAAAPAAAAVAAVAAPAAAAPVPVAAPAGCAIKGNITAKGEKVYHVPGGTYYAATKIELDKGERFFCSEAEAQAAGWRAARS